MMKKEMIAGVSMIKEVNNYMKEVYNYMKVMMMWWSRHLRDNIGESTKEKPKTVWSVCGEKYDVWFVPLGFSQEFYVLPPTTNQDLLWKQPLPPADVSSPRGGPEVEGTNLKCWVPFQHRRQKGRYGHHGHNCHHGHHGHEGHQRDTIIIVRTWGPGTIKGPFRTKPSKSSGFLGLETFGKKVILSSALKKMMSECVSDNLDHNDGIWWWWNKRPDDTSECDHPAHAVPNKEEGEGWVFLLWHHRNHYHYNYLHRHFCQHHHHQQHQHFQEQYISK